MRGAKQKEMFEIQISDLRRREIHHLRSVCPCVPQAGECTLIFSYLHRPVLFLGVENFEFQYFWGFFQENEYFWVMKIL